MKPSKQPLKVTQVPTQVQFWNHTRTATPASLDQIEESGALSKATQAKPAVVSRKSQATLGECLKCVNKKVKIRAL